MKLYSSSDPHTGTTMSASRLHTPKRRPIGEEEREQYRRSANFLRATGDWLHERAWSHVVTLTTASTVTTPRLVCEFHKFARLLGRIAQRPLAWFYVIECGYGGDRPHVHALLANTGALSSKQLENAWRLGYTRIVEYDSTRGASYYITKDIARNDVEWGISRRRAPRLLKFR